MDHSVILVSQTNDKDDLVLGSGLGLNRACDAAFDVARSIPGAITCVKVEGSSRIRAVYKFAQNSAVQ